ncbi:MFS transporter [Alkalibacter mobilis]|uniref:MFS transporter n=1 Tax=Alkalibacter mobilis TaxID=2787712 RepID=UPI00189E5330|nr:MFS transporter [Alkalibacter mobilis]MBF7097503.1 MFS transporter [Alkalibacter mobilis]
MKDNNSSGTKWFMLILMLAAFTATFVARFMWSPLQSTMMEVFNIDTAVAGGIFSVFFTGYIITQVPAGILADKFGVKVIMGLSLIVIGLSSWAMTFATGASMAIALRVALGLGAGTIYAGCARVATNYFEPEKRSMAFGVLLAGPNAGFFIASFFGPRILNSLGWQAGFQFAGIFAIAVGILIFLFVKGDKPEGKTQTLSDVFKGFGMLFKNKGVMLISLSGFGLMWFQLALYNWAFGYTKSLGFASSIGTVGVLIALGGIIASLISGAVVDKLHISRRKYLIGGYLATAVAIFIFGAQTELNALLITSFILGLISYSNNTHLTALVIDYSGKQMAATATGFSNFIYQFASQISPPVVGAMLIGTSGVFTTSIWTVMALGPVLGIIFLLLAAKAETTD